MAAFFRGFAISLNIYIIFNIYLFYAAVPKW